jgi:hypothetical protein
LERVVCHGEARLAGYGVRPDIRVDVGSGLVGYIELKAPGRSIDPATFKGREADQFSRLSLLPNVIYTNGQDWILRQFGKPERSAALNLPVTSASSRLQPRDESFGNLVTDFLRWSPDPPRDLPALVRAVSGLCRLLYFEVRDALVGEGGKGRGWGPKSFRGLADEWRRLLFAELNDDNFADQYAQTVTFALLLARRDGISFENRTIEDIAKLLGKQHSLMGRALELLTHEEIAGHGLTVTLDTLTSVIGAVDWSYVDAHDGDAYLYLYEAFLKQYDQTRRKVTGSYYTPNEVVDGMVRMVESILTKKLGQSRGFASRDVTVVDPAMGTGTFLINVLDRFAREIENREGPGSVGPALRDYVGSRLFGMELQLGPFAVAELRHYDALHRYGTQPPAEGLRLFVTDTLDPPDPVAEQLGMWYAPILQSRQEAARFKSDIPVMVVLGNPPYGERPMGGGKWVEGAPPGSKGRAPAPLDAFRTPGNGQHEYKLANAYIHFWRWATWKAFDAHKDHPAGVVAFITLAGYCVSQAFQGMREYLRRTCDEGWIIDLSPEGHQPSVNTRIFPDVQQPICIAIFARTGAPNSTLPASIHRLELNGRREAKLAALAQLSLDDERWIDVQTGWRDPFLPNHDATWLATPMLESLMPWHSPGVKTNRNWVIAPSPDVLRHRWERLISAPVEQKNELMKATTARSISTRFRGEVSSHAILGKPIGEEAGNCPDPVRIGYRSFDRQWIIDDLRLIDRPREELRRKHSASQLYATVPNTEAPTTGPAITFTNLIPDSHHYANRGGEVIPLYLDSGATIPNVAPRLLEFLSECLGARVSAEDLVAYIAGVTAHDGFSVRFAQALADLEIRVPITASLSLWQEATELGKEVIWLHTYGEFFADEHNGRPRSSIDQCAVTLPRERMPRHVRMIPYGENEMPDRLKYDPATETLYIGRGEIKPVPIAVFHYEVSKLKVIKHWFDYRKKNPRRKYTSKLDYIINKSWQPAWTTELLNMITVIGRLIDIEPAQEAVLERILAGPQISIVDLQSAGIVARPPDRLF